MPRKKYQPNSELPYHVWGRSANKEWFDLPMDQTWEIFSNQLYFIHHAYNVRIHNFVLMSNHYHMNVRTPDANLAEGMNHFQGEVSREIGRATGRINQIFGGPYGRSLLTHPSYYLNSYKYTYRNPVEAKMISRVEDYPYSTLPGLLGRKRMIIPVEPDDTLFSDVDGTLRWLNEEYPTADFKDALALGLRRSEFKISKKFEDALGCGAPCGVRRALEI